MDFDAFSKIKTSVNRGIATVGIRTSSSMEKATIKTHIDSISGEVSELTLSVGESCYKLWLEGSTDFTLLNEQMTRIKEKRLEIEQLKSDLITIDERGRQILGSNDKTIKNQDEKLRYVCNKCSATYDVPVNFCRICGQRIE
mgnify:FL=1